MFKSVTFEVVGNQRIVCEGCEQRIERMLKSLPGVGRTRVRAAKQRVDVLFDAAVVGQRAIEEHLRQAGYEVKIVDPTR